MEGPSGGVNPRDPDTALVRSPMRGGDRWRYLTLGPPNCIGGGGRPSGCGSRGGGVRDLRSLGLGSLRRSRSRRSGRGLGLLLLARLDRRGALLEPKAVRLADHRVAADSAELVGDLAGCRAIVPHLLQALDALFGPGHLLTLLQTCPSGHQPIGGSAK